MAVECTETCAMLAQPTSRGELMAQFGTPYRKWESTNGFDAIVIGSGIGGLGVAALLAGRAGKRVLVLERHATKAGGFTHIFKRKGYEWDVGLHYVGEVHRPGSTLRRLFDEITGGRLEWQDMGEVYDTVIVGNDRFEFVAGRREWRDRMVASFPDEAAVIDRYLELIGETVFGARGFFASKALPGPLGATAGPFMRRRFLKHASRTVAEVLDELTGNELLKTVLTAQYGDYGLTPKRASFGIHAMVVNHYLRGAGYPVGGSSRIAAEIIPEIEAAGGAVVIGAEVAEILMERGRAVGVRMADGRELRCPVVISDAGLPNTVHTLLPEGAPGRRALAGVLGRTSPSTSHICLYVGLDATDAELGLGTSNLWVFPGTGHDANLTRFVDDPSSPLPVAYISFPSAKDPDFQNRCPGKATIEVVSVAPYDWFSEWEDTAWQKRGEEYETLKDRLTVRLLEVLAREVPQVAGRIAHTELSTPLSTRHFGAYQRGEIYGLEHTPARFRAAGLRPKSPVPGLWLTGQDVCTAGIAGALFGGVLCASAILGKNLMKS
jgi:all-trans-retinol 13,14-reductase